MYIDDTHIFEANSGMRFIIRIWGDDHTGYILCMYVESKGIQRIEIKTGSEGIRLNTPKYALTKAMEVITSTLYE